MGTTKWKAYIKAPLLFLNRAGSKKEVTMDTKKKLAANSAHHIDDRFDQNLDAQLERSLRSDVDLMIERKLEEEGDELGLIFK